MQTTVRPTVFCLHPLIHLYLNLISIQCTICYLMDWTLAFENAKDFWEEIIPGLSFLCAEDRKPGKNNKEEVFLDQSVMSPQPRSLASSEFTEQNSLSITENRNWSPIDDAKLMQLVQQHNYDWKLIAKSMPKFSKPNIQQRWEFLIKNNNKHSFWKKEEDELIIKLYKAYNGNWKKISELVPGRSLAALKNRYYGVLKKREFQPKSEREAAESPEPIHTALTVETMNSDDHHARKCVSPDILSQANEETLTPEQKRGRISQLYNDMLVLQAQIRKAEEKIKKIQCPNTGKVLNK